MLFKLASYLRIYQLKHIVPPYVDNNGLRRSDRIAGQRNRRVLCAHIRAAKYVGQSGQDLVCAFTIDSAIDKVTVWEIYL